MLSPLFVFISVIFFTTKLAGNSEIIAILSSGVSFKKIAEAIYDRGGYNSSHDLSFKQLHNSAPANVKRIAYTNKYVRNKCADRN